MIKKLILFLAALAALHLCAAAAGNANIGYDPATGLINGTVKTFPNMTSGTAQALAAGAPIDGTTIGGTNTLSYLSSFGSAILLETNSNANSSQSILNLVTSGSGLYLTDLGGGTIQLSTDPTTLHTGLVAYYTLDETSGDRMDSSGNGYSMVDNDGTGDEGGIIGNCAFFNGSDYLSLSGGYPMTQTWSASCWIRTTSTTGRPFHDLTGVGWQFTINGGGYLQITVNTANTGPFTYNASTNILTDGSWHHLVAIFDGANLTGYVDGNLVISADAIGANEGGFYGSEAETGGDGFIGDVDEAGFWEIALSPTQVSELYNSGAGITFSDF